MKRKYREAMRAKRRLIEQVDDEEATETRNWFDEWAMSRPEQQDESSNQRSPE